MEDRQAELQAVVDDLRIAVDASRTTIRLDREGAVFPVVAESLGPGIASIASASAIDLRGAATFQYMDRTLDILVQDDILDVEHPPPPELIAQYGARAQMLAPIVRSGRMAGFVSAHYSPGPRKWSDEDVATLRAATARAEAVLF